MRASPIAIGSHAVICVMCMCARTYVVLCKGLPNSSYSLTAAVLARFTPLLSITSSTTLRLIIVQVPHCIVVSGTLKYQGLKLPEIIVRTK